MDIKTFEQAEEIVNELRRIEYEHNHFIDVSSELSSDITIYAENNLVKIIHPLRKERVLNAINEVYKQEIENVKKRLERI